MKTRAVIIWSMLVLACDIEDSDVCDVDGKAETSVSGLPLPGRPIEGDLTLRGSASHSEGAAIRNMHVALGEDELRLAISNDGANFDEWTVSIGLTDLAGVEVDGLVALEILATHACSDGPELLARHELTLDRTAFLSDLKIEPPGDPIPANGEVPGTLRVRASAESEGATVTLEAQGLTFDGSDTTTATLVAIGDVAGADVAVKGSSAGEQTVVVYANDQVDTTTVRVAGRPTVSPTNATLVNGQTVTLDVSPEGGIGVRTSCFASPASPSLMLTVPEDEGGSGTFAITAQVVGDDALTTIIRCVDAFGQAGQTTLTINPP